MRELKFRTWDEYGKSLMSNEDIILAGFSPLIAIEGFIKMQFTGLKDKNGVEIYEGDIVVQYETPSHPFDIKQQIFFADGMFCVGRIDDTQTPLSMETDSRIYRGKKVNLIEVVGNIFENPDLLEDY